MRQDAELMFEKVGDCGGCIPPIMHYPGTASGLAVLSPSFIKFLQSSQSHCTMGQVLTACDAASKGRIVLPKVCLWASPAPLPCTNGT